MLEMIVPALPVPAHLVVPALLAVPLLAFVLYLP